MSVCRAAPSRLRFPLKARGVQTGECWMAALGPQQSSAVGNSRCVEAALRGRRSVSVLCPFLHQVSNQQGQTDPPVPGPSLLGWIQPQRVFLLVW